MATSDYRTSLLLSPTGRIQCEREPFPPAGTAIGNCKHRTLIVSELHGEPDIRCKDCNTYWTANLTAEV